MTRTTTSARGSATPIREVTSRILARVHPEVSLREVAEELVADQVGVVIVDGGRDAVGVISERDLVAVVAAGGDLDVHQAVDVMATELVTTDPDTTAGDVALLMIEAGVRHVLVQDAGRVTGIVSQRDVVALLLDDRP